MRLSTSDVRSAAAESPPVDGEANASVIDPLSEAGGGLRGDLYYACRRCRVPLFDATEVLFHDPQEGSKKTFKFRRGNPSQRDGAPGDASSSEHLFMEPCTSLFLDPDQTSWIAEDIREANSSGAVVEPDTIYCRNPRCRAKLGTQSWTGSQCSCGMWITPAFRIHARAVDKVWDKAPTGPARVPAPPQ